jgi:hypothetical protein
MNLQKNLRFHHYHCHQIDYFRLHYRYRLDGPNFHYFQPPPLLLLLHCFQRLQNHLRVDYLQLHYYCFPHPLSPTEINFLRHPHQHHRHHKMTTIRLRKDSRLILLRFHQTILRSNRRFSFYLIKKFILFICF